MKCALVLAVPLFALCGCMSSALDEEVVSSLHFDATACPDLIAQRDALAARYAITASGPALVPGERPKYLEPGVGMLVPDYRSASEKERGRAIGEVAAMDRSIARRKCR